MRKDIALILLILAILALIIVPLGPVMLDILLSVNLTLAVMLLIVSIYLKHPADFPTFPAVILLGTAFRLALSIATTRQILTEAEAGQIIETFGSFVIGGNIAVGLVVFLIITVFQFLVVTKGAERVAEISARFALDALPGKQMSIDADLRSENIDKQTASDRRARLERESQFFGSMDGAMKFVKGDAIAGLIIIFINLVGGISVGMLVLGFSFNDAVETFTLLTLGDGLVAQLPALLMALCAGMVTTRVDGNNNIDLGTDIWRDLVSDPRVPAAAAAIVVLIGLIPGFPILNFIVAAGVLLLVSLSMRRLLTAEAEAAAADVPEDPAVPEVEAPAVRAVSDRVSIHIADDIAELISIEQINATLDGLLGRYAEIRGLAFAPPGVEIVEAAKAGARSFAVALDGVPLTRDIVPPDSLLVLCERGLLPALDIDTRQVKAVRWHEIEGFWVPERFRTALENGDQTPMDLGNYIAMMAFRVIETNVSALFSEEHFKAFIDALRQASPQKQEVLDQRVDRMEFFQTLRYLAEDGVPLQPVGLVADTYLQWVQTQGNVGALELSECMRGSLKRQICHALSQGRGLLGVVLLDPQIEQLARKAIADASAHNSPAASDGIPFDGATSDKILSKFRALTSNLLADDTTPVVLTSAALRRRIRNFLAANRLSLPVLAPHELAPEINVHPIARIDLSGKS